MRNVGKLAAYGEQTEEIRITSSLDRLSQYFADPLRAIQALQQRNIIQSSGKSLDAGTAKVPLRTTGLFTTEDQIRSVLVDVSRTGQPVYIRDFADVERRYQDPAFLVRYDGEPSVLLSIEMQKGKNIVPNWATNSARSSIGSERLYLPIYTSISSRISRIW